jgi:integrase
LAEATVRQVRAILHRSCRLARKWSGGTLPNPIAGTELPDWTLAERGPEVRSPTVEEVRSLLKAAREYNRRTSAIIRFVAATGVRRGEVCAVRWEDINWDSALVRIDESIVADVVGARV